MAEESVGNLSCLLARLLKHGRQIEWNGGTDRGRQQAEIRQVKMMILAVQAFELARVALRDDGADQSNDLTHVRQRLAIDRAERAGDLGLGAGSETQYASSAAHQVQIDRAAGGLEWATNERKRDTGAELQSIGDGAHGAERTERRSEQLRRPHTFDTRRL